MTLAKPLHRGNRLPRLLLMTDARRLPDPLPVLERLVPGSGVVLRHWDQAARAELGQRLKGVIRRRRLVLLVAGDWRLAERLGAAGLHLSEGMARHGLLAGPLGWVRRRRRLLLVACHSRSALGRARILGADGALLSPVFATPSHPGQAGIGPSRFGLWAAGAGLPVLGLGGMKASRLRRLPLAHGMAAIGAFKSP